MFEVPRDRRTTQEQGRGGRVSGRLGPTSSTQPAAVAVSLLHRERIFHAEVAGRRFVVLTTPGGANRIYDAGERRFRAGPAPERLVDNHGTGWTVDEARLQALDGTAPLARVPAARAFCVRGRTLQFPDTVLLR